MQIAYNLTNENLSLNTFTSNTCEIKERCEMVVYEIEVIRAACSGEYGDTQPNQYLF